MLEEEKFPECISWSVDGTSFTVSNPQELEQRVLPSYYKSSKFSSFQRQLNYFGFKKVKKRGYMYTHEQFMKGNKDKLIEIKRKPNTGNLKKRKVKVSTASGKNSESFSPRMCKRPKLAAGKLKPASKEAVRRNSSSPDPHAGDGEDSWTAAASMVMLLQSNSPRPHGLPPNPLTGPPVLHNLVSTSTPNATLSPAFTSTPTPTVKPSIVSYPSPSLHNNNATGDNKIDVEAVMLLAHAVTPRRVEQLNSPIHQHKERPSLQQAQHHSPPPQQLSPQIAA
jgi:hypothetical protein